MFRLCTLLGLLVVSLHAWAWNFEDVSTTLSNCPRNVGAVAWGDVNSDGFQDLFIGGHHGEPSALYFADGSQFQNVSQEYNVEWMTSIRSAQFIDYDQDGLLDLFCLTEDGSGAIVCRQQSDHRFRPIPIPLEQDIASILAASWHDVDQDGFAELFLSLEGTTGPAVSLFHRSSFEFVEERDEFLPYLEMEVASMTWADWNNDGRTDLFLGSANSDHGCRLLTKTETGWEDRTPFETFDSKIGISGCVWSDFNNDQRLDFFTPGLVEHTSLQLFRTDGEKPAFKNAAPGWGLDQLAGSSFDAHAIDANKDGWMDLYVMHHNRIPANSLLINQGGSMWTNVSIEVGIDCSYEQNNACAWADYDNDGDPDLAVAQEGDGVRLFRNNLITSREYIILRLCQPDYCTTLEGCKVLFQFDDAKAVGSTDAWLCSNGDDGSSIILVNSSNTKSSDYRCWVTWPDGQVSEFDARHLQMSKVNTLQMPTENPRIESVSYSGQDRGAGRLIANAPNPFNPTTNITFTLSNAEHVSLNVYDMMGRNVAQLANADFEAGEHSVTFEATNLPTGIYLARLSTVSATVVHRMMLLK